MTYEEGRSRFETLIQDLTSSKRDRNEATTRLQFIDVLFFECLGWDRNDCTSEEEEGRKYTDYSFKTTKRDLIVEAKREGIYFELPAGVNQREYSISSLCRDYKDLKEAIHQAAGYCQTRGVPIGAVCNGHQIVGFVATRNDGTSPLQGRAIVFANVEDMLGDFQTLWNCFSKDGISNSVLEARLLGRTPTIVPAKLSARIVGYPGIMGRNPFQVDLQIVSELVLEDLMQGEELEDEFLSSCYCKSGSLSQYALVSKTILSSRYDALFGDNDEAPTLIPAVSKKGISPELVADSLGKRPILLIGDVGVGKTTFIHHLMRVDAKEVFSDAIVIYLDLGSQGALTMDLREFILSDFVNQLLSTYGIDVFERRFVQGVYHGQLEQFKAGIYQKLLEVDPAAFTKKEVEFLEDKLNQKDNHLRESIAHIAKGRRKQVVVFIDNADQREFETQQQAFLVAQELAQNWQATLFVALRPETFYQSMQQGALSGYHPKAFTISPPQISEVIRKRLEFGLKLADGTYPLKSLPASTQVRFHNLVSIIQSFIGSLSYNSNLMEAIDNISAGNVRRALDLVKVFFGSGHVDTEKIVQISQETGSYIVPLHEFLRSVIYGDNRHYDPQRSVFVNIFDISTNDPKEYFASALMLGLTQSLTGRSGHEGYVDVAVVFESLQDYGYLPSQISFAIQRMLSGKLVESGRAEDRGQQGDLPTRIRITSKGAYHSSKLVDLFVYYDAVVVDTPILDDDVRGHIENVFHLEDRLHRSLVFCGYLDEVWTKMDNDGKVFDWPAISKRLRSDVDRIRTRMGYPS